MDQTVLNLSGPAPAPEAAAAPAPAAAPGPGAESDPATGAGQGKNQDPATPAAAPAVDADERIIELSRNERAANRKAQEATGKVAELEARLQRVEPLAQVFALAEKDPQQFIDEIADVVGLTPERVLDMLATRGAGGEASLSTDDRIAMLERKLEEAKNPKPDPNAEAEQARQGFINQAKAHLEAVPELFPLASKDPAAPDAVFLTQVRHWEMAKAKPGFDQASYRPLTTLQAVHMVEKVLRSRSASGSTPAAAGNRTPPSTTGGLSNSTMGATTPVAADVVLSDQEIRANMLRALGG